MSLKALDVSIRPRWKRCLACLSLPVFAWLACLCLSLPVFHFRFTPGCACTCIFLRDIFLNSTGPYGKGDIHHSPHRIMRSLKLDDASTALTATDLTRPGPLRSLEWKVDRAARTRRGGQDGLQMLAPSAASLHPLKPLYLPICHWPGAAVLWKITGDLDKSRAIILPRAIPQVRGRLAPLTLLAALSAKSGERHNYVREEKKKKKRTRRPVIRRARRAEVKVQGPEESSSTSTRKLHTPMYDEKKAVCKCKMER